MNKLKHNKSYMKQSRRNWIIVVALVFGLTFLSNQVTLATQSTDNNTAKIATTPKECAAGDLIGWIICPIVVWSSKGIDAIYEILSDNFFKINPDFVSEKLPNDKDSPLKTIWQSFRDLANIIIILVFLISIASYLTGFGLKTYQVKKILPKIIVGAILINLSFYITQILIDFSNIAGDSIQKTFTTVINEVANKANMSSPGSGMENPVGQNLSELILGALVINRVNHVSPVLSFVLPIVVTILIVIVTTVIFLFLRQVAAILIIAVSPLAFAANLLPNTERLFKSWKNVLSGILLTYPTISLMFGAGKIASFILQNVASQANGLSSFLMKLLAYAMQILPMVFVPTVVRNSTAKLPVLGQEATRLAGSLSNKIQQKTKNSQLQKNIKTNWQKRKTARELSARRSRSFGSILNSPFAAMDSFGKLGRIKTDQLEQQENQDIKNIAGRLSLADANVIKDFSDDKTILEDGLSNGTIDKADYDEKMRQLEKKLQQNLSQNGRDIFNNMGGKRGNAIGKMSLAASNVLSKQGDTDPEAIARLLLTAGKTGMSDNQIREANKTSENYAKSSGNLALQAAFSDARTTNNANLATGPALNSAYANYLLHANRNNLAAADARSLSFMRPTIESMARTTGAAYDPAFRNTIQQITSDYTINASSATRNKFGTML